MNPRVAVLLCVCNAERYLPEAVESILSQTYSEFEFVIVDNGSTDSTWDIIRSYTDPRIKAFQLPLKQLAFSLNYGLIQTQAEYVVRMDADDISRPQRIASQVAYLDAHPEVAVLGTGVEFFKDDRTLRVVRLPATDRQIRQRLPFRFSLCHPAVIFKRNIILKHGGYLGGRQCQDLDLWLRLSRDKTIQFANLEEPLIRYRISQAQTKGSRESYATSAGLLLREALLQRSPYLFAASALAAAKIVRSCK